VYGAEDDETSVFHTILAVKHNVTQYLHVENMDVTSLVYDVHIYLSMKQSL
jgi:hypothetical protein